MTTQDKLNSLLLKRKIPYERLKESYEYFVKNGEDEKYKHLLLVRGEAMEAAYSDFQKQHNSIIALITDADFEGQDSIRSKADFYYFSVKGKYHELSSQTVDTPPAPANDSSTATAKLPKINLPTFSGNFKSWPAYFDLFNSLINTNNKLSDVEKFHFLITSLDKEPLNLVKSLPMTGGNYVVAYQALVKRYQNRRFLATSYFNEIYTASPLQKASAKDLRSLIDLFSENLGALKVLDFDVSSWDFIMFNILLQKLDYKTRMDFEMQHSETEMPTHDDLIKFLENHCRALESIESMVPMKSKVSSSSSSTQSALQSKTSLKKPPGTSAFINTVSSSKASEQKCPLCSSRHALHRCYTFLAKTPKERFTIAKQHKSCLNCLQSSHEWRQCSSKATCKVCNVKHHTLLHFPTELPSTENTDAQTSPQSGEPSSSPSSVASSLAAVASTKPSQQSTVLLSTAEVEIRDIRNNFQRVRVLIDTASMANFISEACCNRLGLARSHFSIPINGLNDMNSMSTKGKTHCTIKPLHNLAPLFSFDAIVIPKICSNLPNVLVNTTNWSHLRNLPLADAKFNIPGPIDILIGAELVPYVLRSGRIFGNESEPVALETVFGWILQGKAHFETSNLAVSNQTTSSTCGVISCHAAIDTSFDYTFQRFWELEQVPKNLRVLSPEESQCESLYKNSVQRDATGRFTVALPFRHSNPDFGDSYTQAHRRLLLLERRFERNPQLKTDYSAFIREYLDKNYMSEVPRSEYRFSSAYYLPHFCVLKASSSTALRVVLDASAKGSSGFSLNDALFPGPKLQTDIVAILLKFRFFPVAFICDIKQMYSQILVTSQHRDFQRILWRFDSSDEVHEYRLNRVSFGVSSAPYLALRTIQELAQQERKDFPVAAQLLQEHIYIDDICAGALDTPTALQLQKDLIALLQRGGFELRKWASNCKDILSAVPSSDTQMSLDFDNLDMSTCSNFIKVLGLQWDPSRDVFSYSCTPIESKCTKRNILSQIARIYDPCGYISPVVLLAKYLMQQLWALQIDWDEKPPDQIIDLWKRFQTELPELRQLQIPRLLFESGISRVEMHGFADASTKAYGCVVYFRYLTVLGSVGTCFICSKSRVAPLKTVSLPRLELCAALMLAKLMDFVKNTYSKLICLDSMHSWSDSQCALSWISSSPHRWQTFVANRVAHIQDLSLDTTWNYVPSAENPADIVSRGATPTQLLEQSLWWSGPSFLFKSPDLWPSQNKSSEFSMEDVAKEEKKIVLHTVLKEESILSGLLDRFSSLQKIQRTLAYIYRFKPPRSSTNQRSDTPSLDELNHALQILVKFVQVECFADLLDCLSNNKLLSKSMRKLAPFLDEVGIVRVGGRLRKSSLPFEVKHPILLPKSHRLTDLIVEKIHKDNCHPGLKTMQNLVYQKFWILSPRSAIYRCLAHCIRCFRAKPKSLSPSMADLPSFRISQVKAFSNVSLDYAGYFKITLAKTRNPKILKAYVCVFVCCATKALHLELVSDLSTEAFLAAFRRFQARRGRISNLYSDQGTNFVGANNLLKVYAQQAAQQLSITWHFSPAGGPHFNGLSESAVKSLKTHLNKVTDSHLMTYEEFYTLLCQIEAVLNSRPLCAMSEDPNDLLPLTPGHFLTMEPITSFPEPELSNINLNRLNRWQLLQRMHADFWKRWSREYLHTLQQRTRWTTSCSNLALGSLVLIKDEQKSPLQWSLGRVVRLHPGTDGVVRVATLKTQQGTLQRPVVKLCPLPGQ